jgi:hypothetical protein
MWVTVGAFYYSLVLYGESLNQPVLLMAFGIMNLFIHFSKSALLLFVVKNMLFLRRVPGIPGLV